MSLDYYTLSPEKVLDAVESQGLIPDGRYIVLNSYENRVYQVNLEHQAPMVAKFYRPNRWSDAAILEEHAFTCQLAEQGLPIVAPWQNSAKETLFYFEGFRFSIYPRQGGTAPEPGHLDQLYRLGMLLGRMHAFGATSPFTSRPALTIDSYCHQPAQFLLTEGFIPPEHQAIYQELIASISSQCESLLNSLPNLRYIRTHCDFHLSNIIWTRSHQDNDGGPYVLDFDDSRMAPAVQDFWMLLNGDRPQQQLQLSELLEGYHTFYEFNLSELQLIEPLRALRLIHYNGWLAKRWQDPAFKYHFSWFNTPHYWQQHISELSEQLDVIQLPSLHVFN